MIFDNRSLALLYIDASRLSQIEQDYGSQVYEDVLKLLTGLIMEMRGRQTRQNDLVTVNERHGDVFLIFLSKKREERPFGRGDLENLADRIHTYLSKRIYRMTCSYLRGRPKVSIGYGLVLHNPLIKEERLILKLIDDARRMADALIAVATDAGQHSTLAERALAQAARFSWEKTAHQTLSAYEEVFS